MFILYRGSFSVHQRTFCGPSAVKWFAIPTPKNALCWGELRFCPGGGWLWELTCCSPRCGTVVSLTQYHLPSPLLWEWACPTGGAHLTLTVHVLNNLLNTPPSSRRGHSNQTPDVGSSGAHHLQQQTTPQRDLFYLFWSLYKIPNDDAHGQTNCKAKALGACITNCDFHLPRLSQHKATSDFEPFCIVAYRDIRTHVTCKHIKYMKCVVLAFCLSVTIQ